MLAVMDPETRNHKGKNTIGEAKRVALRTLLDGVPAYLNLAPHLSFSGAKFLANRVAEQLATATKNSVVVRIWGFQRKALRFRLRRALFLQNLGLPTAQKISISGKEMEKLLTDLQLFTRDPGNFKAHGQYGFEAPYSIINNLIQDEFARLPYLQLPSTVPVTRRILKAHWCLFLSYLITLSEECTFWQLWERQRKEIEELYPDLKVTSPLQPPKCFSPLPLFNYSRKAIKLEPEAWKQVLQSVNIKFNGELPFLSFFLFSFFLFFFFCLSPFVDSNSCLFVSSCRD